MTPVVLAYLLTPFVLKSVAPRTRWVDWIIILQLWLPVEFGLISLWFVPILAGASLVFIYQYQWPLSMPWRIGWHWPSEKNILLALYAVLALAVPLAIIGFAVGFIQRSLHPFHPQIVRKVFVIAAFALVEEILFRGLIQNLLEEAFRNRYLALGVTAIVFGVAHINNAAATFAIPNWRYVGLATIAGVGYGFVWMRTRNMMASAITHTMINLIWKVFLL